MGIITENEKMPPSTISETVATSQQTKSTDKDDVEATAKQSHKTGKLEAAVLLFKGSVGAGLFAMGDCFKNGGLVGATILLPVIAIITVHCEQILISGSEMAVSRTPGAVFYDYPETVEKCFEYGAKPFRRFSKVMKVTVEVFLFVTQFGFCSIYFVFISENISQVLIANGVNFSQNTTMLIALLPAMIPSLFTNIKYVSPISLLANFALLFGLIATLSIAFTDGPLPSPSERNLITNGPQMALFFGTALFSYEGIALILPLRNTMREPAKFSSRFGVLNVTLATVTFLFIFTGFVSYLRWGEDVEGSISLNLDVTQIFSQVVKIIAALGVFFGFPIQFFIMIRIIWPSCKRASIAQKYPITTQVVLRFIMVLLTFGVALVVPNLSVFISLIGALCSTSLALIFPVLIDTVVRMQMPKALSTTIFIKNSVIFLLAILGIVTGTYQSIVEIIKVFNT